MDELKPCPFCGGKAKFHPVGKITFVAGCSRCGVYTKRYSVYHRGPLKKLETQEKESWCAEEWNNRRVGDS